MITASTFSGYVEIALLLVALGGMLWRLISSARTKHPKIIAVFVAIFLGMCLLSAKIASHDYKAQILRRDTWIRSTALITGRSVDRSPKEGSNYYVTFSFSPPEPSVVGSSPIVKQEELDNQDVYDRYLIGSTITVHYPRGDPSKVRVFIHGDKSDSELMSEKRNDSIVLDGLFGVICIITWWIANFMYSQFFDAAAEMKAEQTAATS